MLTFQQTACTTLTSKFSWPFTDKSNFNFALYEWSYWMLEGIRTYSEKHTSGTIWRLSFPQKNILIHLTWAASNLSVQFRIWRSYRRSLSWFLDNLLDIYSPTIWCLASNRLIIVITQQKRRSSESSRSRSTAPTISENLGYRWCSGSRLRDVAWSFGSERCLRHGGSYYPSGSAADQIIRFGVGGGVLGWIRTFLVGHTQQVLYMGRYVVIHRSTGFRRSAGFGARPSPFPVVYCRTVRSHQQKGAGGTFVRWWYACASQCTSLQITGRSSAVLGVHRGDRRLDAVKQTQNEHRQNPADLDRNAPAAVKGRHQWDRTAAGHGIVLYICVGLGRDSWQPAQDDRSCCGYLSSFNCARYVRSGGRWRQMPGKRWWMHSLWVDWTTVTPCVRASMIIDAFEGLLNKLQHIQNAAARLVTDTRKYDHT